MRNNNRNKNENPNYITNPAMLPQVFSKRVRQCPLSGENAPVIDYKNIDLLQKYTSERGKILPSRITNVCAKNQRKIAKAIKRARVLALMPYTDS